MKLEMLAYDDDYIERVARESGRPSVLRASIRDLMRAQSSLQQAQMACLAQLLGTDLAVGNADVWQLLRDLAAGADAWLSGTISPPESNLPDDGSLGYAWLASYGYAIDGYAIDALAFDGSLGYAWLAFVGKAIDGQPPEYRGYMATAPPGFATLDAMAAGGLPDSEN